MKRLTDIAIELKNVVVDIYQKANYVASVKAIQKLMSSADNKEEYYGRLNGKNLFFITRHCFSKVSISCKFYLKYCLPLFLVLKFSYRCF